MVRVKCRGHTMTNANKATTGGRAVTNGVILAVVLALVGMTGIGIGIVVAPELLALCVPGDLLGPIAANNVDRRPGTRLKHSGIR